MSLGFARDSVHDLSSLAEKTLKSSRLSSLSSTEGDSSEVSLPFHKESKTTRFDLESNHDEQAKDVPSRSTTGAAADQTSASTRTNSSATSSSSYGHYTGFAADYAEYEKYGATYDQYSHSALYAGHTHNNEDGWWCCLMPWMSGVKQIEAEEQDPDLRGISFGSDVESNKSDDDVSTGSAVFGEKLTDNDRAAIVARLRLASPEPMDQATPSKEHHHSSKKGLLNCVPNIDTCTALNDEKVKPKSIKSILRKGSTVIGPGAEGSLGKANQANSEGGGRRRSLFPQQYEQKPKLNKNIEFAPMARVVTVKSKNDMSDLEKSQIWWQKQDYEDFKKTGRIIAKAMCEGGSEVWLASNNAWQSKASRTSSMPRAIHLSDRSEIQQSDDAHSNSVQPDKWWHHFGHSRRGLEHIASVEEGRQRQANVRVAIRVVIDEQKRQKIYRKEDPEKLRMLSLQYTTWARELALAAAASDAEAVESDFHENRKSREFYILKQAKAQGGFSKKLPSFMMPVAVSPQVLDHHTSTQIRFRRKQARVGPSPLPKSEESPTSTSEPIHDGGSGNLAKKAAGFGTGNTDASAILSGLGSSNDNAMSPMKLQMASVGAH